MNTARGPPKPSVILATPLNVEESRAQRQQRSQARFRDRGGIFVPSNRNILADILLGKASPLKKPRRSVSASPSRKSFAKPAGESLTKSTYKDLVVQGDVFNATTRRSPRKAERKSAHDALRPLSVEQTQLLKKSTAQKGHSNPKALAKPNTTKQSTFAKTSTAKKQLYDIPESGEDVFDDTAASESKSGASKAAKNSAIGQTKSATFPPPTTSPQPVATTSSTTMRPRPRKSQSDLYSGASEDEYIPPVKKTAPRKPRAKQTGKLTKKPARSNKQKAHSQQLADISEGDEEDDPFETAKKSATASGKRKKSKKTDLHEDQQSTSTNDPPRKKAGPVKRAKPTKAKSSKPETTANPSIPAKEKEHAAEVDLPVPARSMQAAKKSTSGKGRKRSAEEDKPSGEAQSSQKRVKRSDPEESTTSNAERTARNKRPREEGARDDAEDYEKGAKRKKSSHKTKDANSKAEVLEKKGAVSKTRSKVVPAKKARKPRSTAKRKENSVSPEETQAKPVEIRGPPKSVLLRIMNSNSLPLVADNEPDEIDFLS